MTTKPTTLSKDPRSARLPKAEHANISWITDSLAIGGDLSWKLSLRRLQVAEIVAMGITCVIDGRIEDDDTAVWAAAGIEYVHVPVNDVSGSHLPRWAFDRAVTAARKAHKAGGKVLAHCHMGINRGPSLGAAILLDRGMAPVEVIKVIKAQRPVAGIYYFMDAYDAHIARNGLTPNGQVRKSVKAHLDALVGTREAIQHITRAIAAHHQRDAKDRSEIRRQRDAEWAAQHRQWALEDAERAEGKDSRLAQHWDEEDQRWWDDLSAQDRAWWDAKNAQDAKAWAEGLSEAELAQIKADDLYEWINSVK